MKTWLFLWMFIIGVQAESVKSVYQSPLAKRGWYSQDKEELKKQLQQLLQIKQEAPDFKINTLVLPHAGIRYSGAIAATGFNLIQAEDFKRIVILGPSHQYQLSNQASCPTYTHYQTPLGEVALDLEFIANLVREEGFIQQNKYHENEHSVQMEIPFLQMIFNDVEIVPVLVGQLDTTGVQTLANGLSKHLDEKTLLLVSSDFVHFGKKFQYTPFKQKIKENIMQLDKKAFQYIQSVDLKGFQTFLLKTGATVCGRNPIQVLLAMLSESSDSALLSYSTSGSMTGDWSHSVSYACLALNRSNKKNILTVKERTTLLRMARKTLEFSFAKGKVPTVEEIVDQKHLSSTLLKKAGVFVSLYEKNKNLRGCIGEIVPKRPLYQAVWRQSILSAFRDHRFKPLQKYELSDVQIEISVLTHPQSIHSYHEIQLGRHGIILKHSGKQAVFLPQVAKEQGWTLEETLAHLSVKAGLDKEAWKKDAKFLIFEASVFSEKKNSIQEN